MPKVSMLRHGAAAIAIVMAVSTAAAANAQAPSESQADAQPVTAPADDVPAGEIVVTAQRRSENLSRVPVAISVVGGAALASANINSAETLQQVVPSLNFKRGTANVNSTLAIRGIGTQSFSSAAEPSVSTVVDGIVYGRSGMAFQEFADVDRIEVLRGPQGTLFGKNASAGALNITTLAPSNELTADASIAYFDRNEYRATANVSGPLSDTIKARLSAVYGNYDGNITNIANGSRVNGYERYGFRGKLVGEWGDLKVTLAADLTHAKDDCCADVLGQFIPNAQQTNIFLPAQGLTPRFGSRTINNNFAPGTVDTNAGVGLTIDLKLGDYTLTSITGYRNWRNRQLRDGDFGNAFGRYATSNDGIALNGATMDIDQRDDGSLTFKQYSQELRIASPVGRTVDFVAGAFLWGTNEQDNFTRSVSQCFSTPFLADATGFRPCASAAATFNFVSAPAQWDTHFRSYSGFGQATFNATDTLKFIAGLRYTDDKVYYNFSRVRSAGIAPGVGATYASGRQRAADTGWSGKAGVQWQATPDLMTYASYSRGYKGPSLNVFYSMTAANLGTISPETSNAYEIGAKAKLFDRRLTLNLAAFWEDFMGFQANNFVTQQDGTVALSLANAGNVRSRGFEMDFVFNVTRDLNFSGGYTYDEATIRSYNCSANLTPAQLTTCRAHDGKPLPFAPKNKFNVTGNYTLPLGDAVPFKVRLTSSVSFTGRTNFDIDQTPLAQQAPYALWDTSVTFASPDDKYQLSIIGKNLTDKYYTSFVTPNGDGVSAGSYARLQVPRDAERYIGVKASVRY